MSNDSTEVTQALALKTQKMREQLYLYRYRSIKNSEDFVRLIKFMRDGKLYCARREDFNDPFELRAPLSSEAPSDYYPLTKSQREHFQASYENMFDIMRIACFTESYKNLPMWNHYADEHRGVCLEFDTSKLQTPEANNLFPTIYVENLLDAVKFVRDFIDNGRPPFEMTLYTCIQKLHHWDYENEWRYICSAAPECTSHSGIEVSFIRPSKVILGINTAPDIEAELLRVISESKLEINMTRMQITRYGLKENPVSPLQPTRVFLPYLR